MRDPERDPEGEPDPHADQRREQKPPLPGHAQRIASARISAPVVDAGVPPASHPPIDAPPRGTIVVPATAVARAIEKKGVGATNAIGSDGKPFGARMHGVNRYRTGLRDGDVIVSLGGVRTETTKALVDAATKVLAAGATKLTGRIVRGDETWDVVLELPPRT